MFSSSTLTTYNWEAAQDYFQKQSADNIKLSKKLGFTNTNTSFIKFNGVIYAYAEKTDPVGEGSLGVKVKRLISADDNAPALVIKSHKLHKPVKQQFVKMKDINIHKEIQKEVDTLIDLQRTAGIITCQDQSSSGTKYYTVMPFAGKTISAILAEAGKVSFKYLNTRYTNAESIPLNDIQAATIYLYRNDKEQLRSFYLDASDKIQPLDLDDMSDDDRKSLYENTKDLNQDTDLKNIDDDVRNKLIDTCCNVSDGLKPLFNKIPNELNDNQRFDMAIKLCLEVYRLHQGWQSESGTSYAHGDLHPDNYTQDANGKIKLIDFGSSVKNDNSRNAHVNNLITHKYHHAKRSGDGDPVTRDPTVIEWDNFSLMRCIYVNPALASSLDKVGQAKLDRANILTAKMLQDYNLADYFNTENGYCSGTEPNCTNPELRQPESIEIAAVLINAKMGLNLGMQFLKDKKMALTLASLHEQNKSKEEMLEIIENEVSLNQAYESAETVLGKPPVIVKVEEVVNDERNGEPEQPVVAKKSLLESVAGKIFFWMKENPIKAGMLIGFGLVVLATLVAATVYLSGGMAAAALPIYMAAHVIGGGFTVGSGILGSILIGVKLALAGLGLGALCGGIAKCFIKDKEVPQADRIGEPFVSTHAIVGSGTIATGGTNRKYVGNEATSNFNEKKVGGSKGMFDAASNQRRKESGQASQGQENTNSSSYTQK